MKTALQLKNDTKAALRLVVPGLILDLAAGPSSVGTFLFDQEVPSDVEALAAVGGLLSDAKQPYAKLIASKLLTVTTTKYEPKPDEEPTEQEA